MLGTLSPILVVLPERVSRHRRAPRSRRHHRGAHPTPPGALPGRRAPRPIIEDALARALFGATAGEGDLLAPSPYGRLRRSRYTSGARL